MTTLRKALTRERTLLVVDEEQVVKEMQGVTYRRLVCLLSVGRNENALSSSESNPVFGLLGAGCCGFVCFGARSEALHDAIDEIVEQQDLTNVVTTWHRDETVEHVADFFVGVVGADAATLLIAILQPEDVPMREALKTRADAEFRGNPQPG